MNMLSPSLLMVVSSAALMLVGCTQTTPAPTSAPSAATKAPAAAPTTAPVASVPTAAPAKQIDWPQKGKTITVLMPVAAGGGMDLLGRLTTPIMEKELGVPIEVINKAGAAHQVALTELTKSKPDGYTLMYYASPTAQIAYYDPSRQAPFERKSFAPIAGQVADPAVLAVRPDSPYKTVKDVVDAAKANPEKVKVALSGPITGTAFALTDLERATGTKFARVNFDSQAPMTTALLGGHVDLQVSFVGDTASRAKTGELRVLGVMSKTESPFLPGIKTAESQGFSVYQTVVRGLIGVGGTPTEVVDLLATVFKKAMDDPEFKKKATEMGFTLQYMSPSEMSKWWDEQDVTMMPIIEKAITEAAKQ